MAKVIKFPKKNGKADMKVNVTLLDQKKIKQAYNQIFSFCYGLEATNTVSFEELTYSLLEATIQYAHLSDMTAEETMDLFHSIEIEELDVPKH